MRNAIKSAAVKVGFSVVETAHGVFPVGQARAVLERRLRRAHGVDVHSRVSSVTRGPTPGPLTWSASKARSRSAAPPPRHGPRDVFKIVLWWVAGCEGVVVGERFS